VLRASKSHAAACSTSWPDKPSGHLSQACRRPRAPGFWPTVGLVGRHAVRRPFASARPSVAALVCSAGAIHRLRPHARTSPPTTHAGLTERALEASRLHSVLARLGRPLGVLEPLHIGLDLLDQDARRVLCKPDSTHFDPSGRLSAGPDGVAGAGAWVVAGAGVGQDAARARGESLLGSGEREGT